MHLKLKFWKLTILPRKHAYMYTRSDTYLMEAHSTLAFGILTEFVVSSWLSAWKNTPEKKTGGQKISFLSDSSLTEYSSVRKSSENENQIVRTNCKRLADVCHDDAVIICSQVSSSSSEYSWVMSDKIRKAQKHTSYYFPTTVRYGCIRRRWPIWGNLGVATERCLTMSETWVACVDDPVGVSTSTRWGELSWSVTRYGLGSQSAISLQSSDNINDKWQAAACTYIGYFFFFFSLL